MAVHDMLMSAAGGTAGAVNYIDDVFSTYLYTGNGTSQTHSNGIDLAGKGGLVWLKQRSAVENHYLQDSSSSFANSLSSNTTAATIVGFGAVTSVSSTGFTTSSVSGGTTYASWTFRKQPKFFDIVTYTGNGATGAGQTISHNLGATPGCIIVKTTSGAGNWKVYHRLGNSGSSPGVGNLNTTDAFSTSSTSFFPSVTSTTFSVSDDGPGVNNNGNSYVAYLFAHDAGGFGTAGTDNVISCGSYVDNTTGTISVNLGYEPQWILAKPATSVNDWFMVDVMRGDSVTSAQYLYANKSNAEMGPNSGLWYPTATGFSIPGSNSGDTWIYIAIRRPMKPPTTGTEVFKTVTSSTSSNPRTIVTDFPVDLTMCRYTSSAAHDNVFDRLRGGSTNYYNYLTTDTTDSESTGTGLGIGFDSNTSIVDNGVFAVGSTANRVYWNFKRAPTFFDEVCYTGTGVARTVNHNLGVVPEMMIVKARNDARDWMVYCAGLTANNFIKLNLANAQSSSNYAYLFGNNTVGVPPTSSVFTVGSGTDTNGSGNTYIAYLFASCPGVSKVGSYTGTGTTQQINCGFSGGARFVLIKRTDSTGDWYVWDTARGIVSGNDPYLLLNSTAAEVTSTDYIDPSSSGFEISSTAPAAINASGGSYIYLAIA